MATITTPNSEGCRRRLPGWLAALISSAALCGNAVAQEGAGGPAEAAVKAAFVYKFVGYVEWPDSSVAGGPLTIGVAGAPEIEAELRRIAPGRTVARRSIDVRSVTNESDVRGVQVLLIGAEANARTDRLIAAARQSPILVITDTADGLERGAMINFVMVKRRVQFEIALEPAEKAGLALSSRLLSVALRVKKGDIPSDVLLAAIRIDGARRALSRSAMARVFFTIRAKERRFVSLA